MISVPACKATPAGGVRSSYPLFVPSAPSDRRCLDSRRRAYFAVAVGAKSLLLLLLAIDNAPS